jgi:hypothetical protein
MIKRQASRIVRFTAKITMHPRSKKSNPHLRHVFGRSATQGRTDRVGATSSNNTDDQNELGRMSQRFSDSVDDGGGGGGGRSVRGRSHSQCVPQHATRGKQMGGIREWEAEGTTKYR